jgi:SHS2 domain-containing protein
MPAVYTIFDHTADLGIHVEADSFASLLVDAATAVTSVLIANPEAIRPDTPVELRIDGAKPEELLVDWLADIVYRFSVDHMAFSRWEVSRHDGPILARAWGEPVDPSRHQIDTEIKAVTYHRLKVEQREGRWLAEVIVDL